MGIGGVILGILAIGCAFLATFLFGTTGGIIAGVLGAAAVVLGILKRKKDKKGGIAAMIIGAVAIVMAIVMVGAVSNMFSQLHAKALEYKPDGLWAKADNYNGGVWGLINNLPRDEATLNALLDEMNELNSMINQK